MKKKLVKILKVTGIAILSLLAVLAFLIFFTGPQLPQDTDKIIDNVIASPLPEFVTGRSGFVFSGNTRIWYESISPKTPAKGTILLFMGINLDALGWPQSFLNKLVDSGYQVVRFDYRGTGMSDWMEKWKKKPYSISDLASDAVTILDTLKVSKAHLVGVSMGGMVAQEFALDFPERTLTLTSIMSSGNIMDSELPGISKSTALNLVKTAIKYGIIPSEKNILKLYLASRITLRDNANYDIDIKEIAEQALYNLRKRHGLNPSASLQHQEAVKLSGSRYERLKNLTIPVLVMHGINDPFIPIEHSKKLASVIPGAKSMWFNNMGHDLPPILYDSLVNEINMNCERAK